MFVFVHALVFCAVFGESLAAQLCVAQTPCRCVLDDRTVIDLSAVGLVGMPRFSDLPGPKRIKNDSVIYYEDTGLYSYNPCHPFTKTQTRQTTDPGNRPCVDVAACRMSPGKSDGSPPELHAIGVQNTANFYKKDNGTFIRYSVPGLTKNLTVELVCNETEDHYLYVSYGEGSIIPTSNIRMVLISKCACPDGCPTKDPDDDTSHGLSTGSILLITFVIIIVVYFGLGILYNFCNGAHGEELLPNSVFWNDVPKLVIEGFVYTCSCFSRRTTYGEV